MRDVQPVAVVQTSDNAVIGDIGFCQHWRYNVSISRYRAMGRHPEGTRPPQTPPPGNSCYSMTLKERSCQQRELCRQALHVLQQRTSISIIKRGDAVLRALEAPTGAC